MGSCRDCQTIDRRAVSQHFGGVVTTICGALIGGKIGRRASPTALPYLGLSGARFCGMRNAKSPPSRMSRDLLTGPAAIATLPCYRVRDVPILREVAP